MNRLLAHLPIRHVCAYDLRATADEILADVESTHPQLTLPAGRSTPRRPYEDPVALLNARQGAEGKRLDETPADLDLLHPAPGSTRAAVSAVAARSGLQDADIDRLCLCAAAVIANAHRYGRPPVRLRAWAEDARVTVTIHDAGRGPADMFTGLLPSATTAPDEHRSLHLVHQCVSDVALYTDDTGFTVRLVQCACGSGGSSVAGPGCQPQ